MRAIHLTVNHITNNLIGVDWKVPRLGWLCQGGLRQTAWQVHAVNDQGQTLWDSGKVSGSEMAALWEGPTLASRERVIWQVRLWDEKDEAGEWSESSSFELGLLRENDWQALWINPESEIDPKERQPASYLKKSFHLSVISKKARAYVTAHGIYNLYVNGEPIEDYWLAPGNSQYNRRLQVQAYDVTKWLKSGNNEILVTLGDGWYRGSVDNGMNRNTFGTDVVLLFQLEADGKPVVVSDESWLASQNGPLGLNDNMIGEEYDARKEMINDWHPVSVVDFGYDHLIGTNTPPVIPHERFSAKMITTPAGETVLDFGQNMAGVVQFALQAKSGQRITMTHGETLDENGNFTIQNFQNAGKLIRHQRIIYTCKEGKNIFHPTKCYFGFRYVKVEADFPVNPEDFTALALYTDMEQTGFFSCGNELVNQLVHNSLWSMKSNFVDIPTDCPTREKSGYSGDVQVFSSTAMYLMDCYPVLARWIAEQAATQAEDGCIFQVAPRNGRRIPMDGGTGWCDSFEMISWRMFERTNDPQLMETYYEQMKSWMMFSLNRQKKTRLRNRFKVPAELRPYYADKGVHWGEWLEPGMAGKELKKYMMRIFTSGSPESATAYLSVGCRVMAQMAAQLGKTEDASFFADASDKARKAYRYCYVHDGKIEDSSRQCLYVRPIALGMLDPNEMKDAADTLAEKVHKNGNHLNTGFLSTPEICRVLTDHGHAKTAYDLLLQENRPGWLYAVRNGATTILESWDGIDEHGRPSSSFNHYSYGAVVGWLFDRVCGITVRQNQVIIHPYPDPRLKYVDGIYRSPMGEICSEWRYDGEKLTLTISIPVNVEATVILPDGREEKAGPGIHAYTIEQKKV